jgi:hypothetical protein
MSHPFKQQALAEILAKRHGSRLPAVNVGETKRQFGERLVREGLLTAEEFLQGLSEQLLLPYVDLSGCTIGPELFARLPAAQAYQLGVAPYRLSGSTIEVATSNPYDLINAL